MGVSDKEALRLFSRQPVSQEMIAFLVNTTKSVLQIRRKKPLYQPLKDTGMLVSPVKGPVALSDFIYRLIKYLNVQTPTLMASLIFLDRLRRILPANSVGMETTRHRVFLASLILSAKFLNDSSPLNKHWARYTDGLLSVDEVNMAERELIALLKWDITIREDELILVLQPFLSGIKESIAKRERDESIKKINYYRLSNVYKSPSTGSPSFHSISSVNSDMSLRSGGSSSYTLSSLGEEHDELGLSMNHSALLSLTCLAAGSRTSGGPIYAKGRKIPYTLHQPERAPLTTKSSLLLNIDSSTLKEKYMAHPSANYNNYSSSSINLMSTGRILV